MGIHGFVSAIRRIPRKLTCIKQSHETVRKFSGNTACDKLGLDIVLVQFLSSHVQFV